MKPFKWYTLRLRDRSDAVMAICEVEATREIRVRRNIPTASTSEQIADELAGMNVTARYLHDTFHCRMQAPTVVAPEAKGGAGRE